MVWWGLRGAVGVGWDGAGSILGTPMPVGTPSAAGLPARVGVLYLKGWCVAR